METTNVKMPLSYMELAELVRALTTAVAGNLMSFEEARFIWKRHMISVGWKEATSIKEEAVPAKKKGK